MADSKMQAATATAGGLQNQESNRQEQALKAMEQYGGFAAIKGFIPAAEPMNPAKKATKGVFLNEKKYHDKREALAKELRGWIDLLAEDKANAVEYAEACKQQQEHYQQLLEKNVTIALDATKQMEMAYRSLDSFFKNANDDKLYNLRLVNVNRDAINDPSSNLFEEVGQVIKNGYDRLSLRDSYSLLVVPGSKGDFRGCASFEDKATLLKWAEMAHKYKVMLVADYEQTESFEELQEGTAEYRDSDTALQNVILTGNWIAGRNKEELSETERESDDKAFFIPASAALAGKLYDETANMAQGAGGKRYGTLTDVKGVQVDLLKSEIAALMDNQIVPMVYSEGRVMAFNNSNLFNGDNVAMREYPVVRIFDWIKKVLMNFVHDVALENWDPFNTPNQLQSKIRNFLNECQSQGNLIRSFSVGLPTQDPATGRVSVDVDITPFIAAKNFIIKLSADKKEKSCEQE